MPGKTRLSSCFKDLLKEAGRHLSRDSSISEKDLHHLRVAIKKARALTRLSDLLDKKSNAEKQVRPLRKIFRHAGKIREAQINLRFIKQFGITGKKLKAAEKKKERIQQVKFDSGHRKYQRVLKNVRSAATEQLSDASEKKLHLLYKKKLDKISLYFRSGKFPEDLHPVRKEIKFLLYNYEIVHPVMLKEMKLNKHYLDELQELIGKWHDAISAIGIAEKKSGNETAINSIAVQIQKNLSLIRLNARDFSRRAVLHT